jgi:hypothetical protein
VPSLLFEAFLVRHDDAVSASSGITIRDGDSNNHAKAPFPVKYKPLMTINLHAKSDFKKGDLGRVSGHVVTKTTTSDKRGSLVTALQDVTAGNNGWFEKTD